METQRLTRLLPLLLLLLVPLPEHGVGSANSQWSPEEDHGGTIDDGNYYNDYYVYNLPEYRNSLPEDYTNQWAVKDDAAGLDFGQDETKNEDFVKGFYYALLPDNRKQTVTYEINGDGGYEAHVSYDQEDSDDQHSDGTQTNPVDLYKPPTYTYPPPPTTPPHTYLPPPTTPPHTYPPRTTTPPTTPPHTYPPPTTSHGYNYDPPKTPVNLYETPSAPHLDVRTANGR